MDAAGFNTCLNHSMKFTGLYELASRLVNTFLDKASRNNSFFINEIPQDLLLDANPQMFASVLSGLLSTVVSFAKDSCIRLTAKTYGNVILLQVKDSNTFYKYSIDKEIKKLQPLAEKMKGSISVTSQRKKLTTITFGFPNFQLND